MTDDDVAGLFWQKFPQLQRYADRARADCRAWAIDEGIETLLDRMAGGDQPSLTATDVEALPKSLWKLVANRKKKHGRRREIALKVLPWNPPRAMAHELHPSPSAISEARNGPAHRLVGAETEAMVRSKVTPEQWRVLLRVATGEGYEALASELERPVGTLKSQVARCRKRLEAAVAC
jgi:hypothetical protein